MSKLWYTTFGGADYEVTTAKIIENAPKFGADRVLVYDDVWLTEHEFFKVPGNQWLWQHHWRRGMGWFAWKALILLDTFEKMADGDVVIYTDADTYPVADLTLIKDIVERDNAMWFQASGNVNKHWCKAAAFVCMAQQKPEYFEGPAGNAGVLALKKGPWETKQFLMEWLTYMVNPSANTLDVSVVGREHPEFKEHRADQAIMTLLCMKYGWTCHRDPSQFGNDFPRGEYLYPQLFNHDNQTTSSPSDPKGSKFRNV
jgi:hypothetical protein